MATNSFSENWHGKKALILGYNGFFYGKNNEKYIILLYNQKNGR